MCLFKGFIFILTAFGLMLLYQLFLLKKPLKIKLPEQEKEPITVGDILTELNITTI